MDSTKPASRSTRRCLDTIGCGMPSCRSISPTDCWDETSRLNIARRFGSAMISNTDSILLVYSSEHIRVKVYSGGEAGRSSADEWFVWLKRLERAAGTCCKIRNVMSVLFNCARRYDLYNRNPIQWVRQSAKRRSAPGVLTSKEVRRLLTALKPRERMMVLLDVATGLRQSELFALKWKDVDFKNRQLWVTRSIVQQVVGTAKRRLHKN